MNEEKRLSDVAFKWMTIAGLVLLPIFILCFLPRQFVGSPRSTRNVCINSLRQLDGATQQCAMEQKKKPDDNVTWNDITPYLKVKVVCPEGGKYTIGPAVSNVPTCLIPGHVLP
jgi:hypothetical protein